MTIHPRNGGLRVTPSIYRTPDKLPKFNGPLSVDACPDQRSAAHVLRRVAPHLTKADHKRRRKALLKAVYKTQRAYIVALDNAAWDTWGRTWGNPCDYRVTGIGSDEFSPAHKARLRRLSRAYNRIKARLGAHAWAAEYLCRPKR